MQSFSVDSSLETAGNDKMGGGKESDLEKDFLAKIEDAALNAWPARRQMLYDGWLLRLTGGNSKRVNAVNVRSSSSLPLSQKIRYCEKIYAAEGLSVIFRLPDPFTSPQLVQTLIQMGYSLYEPTYVLGQVLVDDMDLPGDVTARQMPLSEFVQIRAMMTGTPLAAWQVYQSILALIVPEKALMGLFVDEKPVACGMGVLEGRLLGFFSIFTAQGSRRCGYGRGIMRALSDWGISRGATYGYLQVEEYNAPALGLYQALGFERCYQYRYAMTLC
jgi:N-acetylglutamate synthase